jgi:hypothetical protein
MHASEPKEIISGASLNMVSQHLLGSLHIKPNRVDHDSQQIGRAENGELPAVARNGPRDERRQLSDKTMSLYSENHYLYLR